MVFVKKQFEKLEGRVSTLEVTVEKLSQKVDDFIAESRANSARQDARMVKLEEKVDSSIRQMHNMTIAVMVGVGAMVVAVGAIAAAVISLVAAK